MLWSLFFVCRTCEPFFLTTSTQAAYAWQTRSDRKSTRLNSSHLVISYAVFCLKKKKKHYRSSIDNYKTNDLFAPYTCHICNYNIIRTNVQFIHTPPHLLSSDNAPQLHYDYNEH